MNSFNRLETDNFPLASKKPNIDTSSFSNNLLVAEYSSGNARTVRSCGNLRSAIALEFSKLESKFDKVFV